ncbi:MAG: Sec-independent protein translocase protein TatB [Campylobacterota bacterium]|nr:Sec-independent protein translocase protein TatB [Campylobacterota bacterium]
MFGMGFTEILIIAVIAILFLGPDKLPSAMVEIAKFFRNAKNTIGSVKETLEEEMDMSEIKKEALAYKAQLEDASSKVSKATDVKSHVSAQVDSIKEEFLDEDEKPTPSAPKEPEEVTFKKKKKDV